MKAYVFRIFTIVFLGMFLFTLAACTQRSATESPPSGNTETTPNTPTTDNTTPGSSTTPEAPSDNTTSGTSTTPTETAPNGTAENQTADEQNMDNWKKHTNNQYKFEVRYPTTWAFKEDTANQAAIFSLTKGQSMIVILPKGEADRGLPAERPIQTEGTLAGKKVTIQKWTKDNSTLSIYYFTENVGDNWIPCKADLKNCNRIEVLAATQDDSKIAEKILSTLKFL